MKNRVKLVVLCGLMAFPMMVAFQNCSRTVAMQVTDEFGSGKLDTDLLPNGISEVDQQNPSSNDGSNNPSGVDEVSQPVDSNMPSNDQVSNQPPSSESQPPASNEGQQSPSGISEPDPEMNFQVENPVEELKQDVSKAAEECEADRNESNNWQDGELSADGLSLTHIRGNKIISPADFNGATSVNEISDAFGFIIVCDLEVASMSNTGGRIILVNSLVKDMAGHKGDIGVSESRAIIRESKAKVEKQNINSSNGKGPISHAQKKERENL